MKSTLLTVPAMLMCLTVFATEDDRKSQSARETYNRAQELQGKHDLSSAEELYSRLLHNAETPADVRAAAGLCAGDCLLALNRPASARQAFLLVLKECGDQPDVARRARKSLDKIPPNAEDQAASVLDGKSVELCFDGESVSSVAAWLANELHVAVLPDAGAKDLATRKITVDIRSQTAAEAIRQLAAASESAIVERSGLLIWTTPERAALLEKRTPAADLKGEDEPSEAALKNALGKELVGAFDDLTCQRFLDILLRKTGIDVDAEVLPEGAFSLQLGAQVPVLELLDAVAFELDLQLTVRNGKLVLARP